MRFTAIQDPTQAPLTAAALSFQTRRWLLILPAVLCGIMQQNTALKLEIRHLISPTALSLIMPAPAPQYLFLVAYQVGSLRVRQSRTTTRVSGAPTEAGRHPLLSRARF